MLIRICVKYGLVVVKTLIRSSTLRDANHSLIPSEASFACCCRSSSLLALAFFFFLVDGLCGWAVSLPSWVLLVEFSWSSRSVGAELALVDASFSLLSSWSSIWESVASPSTFPASVNAWVLAAELLSPALLPGLLPSSPWPSTAASSSLTLCSTSSPVLVCSVSVYISFELSYYSKLTAASMSRWSKASKSAYSLSSDSLILLSSSKTFPAVLPFTFFASFLVVVLRGEAISSTVAISP